jgi:hypothetical protein
MTSTTDKPGMAETILYRAPAPDSGSGEAWGQLHSLLVPGETVVAHALRHRLYALVQRRNLAAATTGRFIFMTRPLLGGYDPISVRWQDLKEARLTVGTFSATVTLLYSANLSDTAMGEGETRMIRANGLTIAPAQALYRACQAQEQAWREKRRIRTLEETRAAAGGVQIATGLYPPGVEAPPTLESSLSSPAEDPARRLGRAREMLTQGLISDSEYEAIKARIIGAL